MSQKPFLILGAGGHGRVVVDILRRRGVELLGILDSNTTLHGSSNDGVRVLGGDDVVAKHAPNTVELVNALGNTARKGDNGLGPRTALFSTFKAKGYSFAQVISADAFVSERATLGEGCHVITRAVVHAGCVIGDNAIINTGAQIDHDCRIGAHSHIAPGAILCGRVTIGEGSHIGAGAVIIEGVTLAPRSLVPAGTVVKRDL